MSCRVTRFVIDTPGDLPTNLTADLPTPSVVVSVAIILFVVVILLNLLIAILSDTYEMVID